MKLTKETLKRIIKEELDATLILMEGDLPIPGPGYEDNYLINGNGWVGNLISDRFIKRENMSLGKPDLLASALKQSLSGGHHETPEEAAQKLLDYIKAKPNDPQITRGQANTPDRAQLIEFLEWAKTQ